MHKNKNIILLEKALITRPGQRIKETLVEALTKYYCELLKQLLINIEKIKRKIFIQ